MTKEQEIAPWVRAAWVAIGVFAMVRAVEVLHPAINMLAMLANKGMNYDVILWGLVGSLPAPTVLLVGGYCLIRHSPYLTMWATRKADQQIPYGEYAAYRLAFTLAGILTISWALPRLGEVTVNLASQDSPFGEEYRRSAWNTLLWLVVQCGIGAYLIIGAPHIIRWQHGRSDRAMSQPSSDSLQQQCENETSNGDSTI